MNRQEQEHVTEGLRMLNNIAVLVRTSGMTAAGTATV